MKIEVFINGKPYEVEVDAEEKSGHPNMEGLQSVVLPAPGAAVHPGEAGRIYRSPVAGLVVSVNVKLGQAVRKNDELLVLEAMKMETRMTAATAGQVKCIHVAKGEAVKKDQILLELE